MFPHNSYGMVINAFHDFVAFDDTDMVCRTFAPIVPEHWRADLVRSDDYMHLVQWETGGMSDVWTDIFRCDNEIVLHLAGVAFKDSPGECHVIQKRGKKNNSGCQAFFACKGQFVGSNAV